MATDQRNLPAFFSTDADFQTWGQGIEAQLVACGLVVTADTGQVNLATMTRPAINNYAGYRMYRFSDALQATKPVFIKLEYGVAGTTDRPAWRVQIGTNTNGAGTLTGQVSTALVVAQASSKTAGATLASYCSGDGSALRLVSNMDLTASGFRLFLFVERFRNADGTANANGVFWYSGGQSIASSIVPFIGTVPASNSSLSGLPMVNYATTGQQSAAGSEVALFPMFGVWGRLYPLLGVAGYANPDIGAGVAFATSSWLGATRTFMPFGSIGPNGPAGTSQSIAILWE